MSTHDIVTAVATWTVATCDPPIQGSYPYIPSSKTTALPDVVVEVAEKTLVIDDPRFPFAALQQTFIRVWSLGVSIMVDNTSPDDAAEQLEDYADQLEAAIFQDSTLGGTVPFVSPFLNFDFTAPFVEYPDGTRGREMNMTMHVGELVEAQQ